MRRTRRMFALALLCAVVVLGTSVAAVGAPPRSSLRVVLSGLSSPKGLASDLDGNLIIGQGAFGPPGPVLLFVLRGPDRGTTIELTDPVNVTDVAVGPDGSGWAISEGVLYRQAPGGEPQPVLDIIAYQETDPDPFDQEGNPTESNPYGLAILPTGDALVADAAGNDLLRVTAAGVATTVARFDVEAISTDHLPPDLNLPPTIDAEAVPTTVTIGPDGGVYVGELKGFPFRPGSSHVWRIDPNATGVVCSVNNPDPGCSIYASNFTAIQDIAFEPQQRHRDGQPTLYVYELAREGVLAFEEGFATGQFPPAVLLKVSGARRSELVPGRLSQPGGIVATGHGHVFVTDGMFGDGRLVHIRS